MNLTQKRVQRPTSVSCWILEFWCLSLKY